MTEDVRWNLIESDPGVFTEMIDGFGVESLECEEIYDLSETSNVSDAFGFIFLFNCNTKSEEVGKVIHDEREKGIFFAKQMKGTALSNSDRIRVVHNCFSSCQLFEFDNKLPDAGDDVYHFVSYLPINGTLYELDGLKPGPIDHGKIPDGLTWIEFLRPLLTNRMEKCVDGKFNILAVVPKKLTMYEQQLAALTSSSPTEQSTDCITELQNNIQREKKKFAVYKAENIRRRHNYLPLVMELFKIMAENGRLAGSVEKAQTMAQEKNNAARKVKFV